MRRVCSLSCVCVCIMYSQSLQVKRLRRRPFCVQQQPRNRRKLLQPARRDRENNTITLNLDIRPNKYLQKSKRDAYSSHNSQYILYVLLNHVSTTLCITEQWYTLIAAGTYITVQLICISSITIIFILAARNWRVNVQYISVCFIPVSTTAFELIGDNECIIIMGLFLLLSARHPKHLCYWYHQNYI